jgi:hypothetical protein
MKLVLPEQTFRPDEERVLNITQTMALTLTVRRPDIFSLLSVDAYGDKKEYFWQRVQSFVKSWDVVDSAGNPMPFTQANLERLVLWYPQVFKDLNALARDLYIQYDEDVLGNSETPPPNGGTETQTDLTTSKSSLTSSPQSSLASDAASDSVPIST